MTRALIYQSPNKWRFGTALAAAVAIHLAAISFATSRQVAPKSVPGSPGEPTEITFDPDDPLVNPQSDVSDPLATPPTLDQSFIEPIATPPPVRRPPTKFTPIQRSRIKPVPGSMNVSRAKVFALNAPLPEYPFEARRQKISGDGIAVLTIDPGSGTVIEVTMSKTTGNSFLDNAAITGFRRWRFKPGTTSSVVCPVTFTLTGVSY